MKKSYNDFTKKDKTAEKASAGGFLLGNLW